MTDAARPRPQSPDGHSPLFAELSVFVHQLYDPFRRDKVDYWIMLGTGSRFRITNFDGRIYDYSGVLFDGTPRDVFWGGFVEPFLQDIIIKSVTHAAKLADERGVDRSAAFDDIRALLRMVVRGTYHGMDLVEINQLITRYQTIFTRPRPPFRRTDSQPMADRMYALIEKIFAGWPDKPSAPATPALSATAPSNAVEEPRVDPDGLWAVVQGRRYEFRPGNQAATIRILYKKWLAAGKTDGCGMTEAAIAEAIGTAAMTFRISTTFRGMDALGTVVCRISKSTYALFLNEPQTKSGNAG